MANDTNVLYSKMWSDLYTFFSSVKFLCEASKTTKFTVVHSSLKSIDLVPLKAPLGQEAWNTFTCCFFAKDFTVPELVASVIIGNHLLHLELKCVIFKISEVWDFRKNHLALSLNAWPVKHKEMFVPVFKNTHCQACTGSFPESAQVWLKKHSGLKAEWINFPLPAGWGWKGGQCCSPWHV